MILGDKCTRNCRFCFVKTELPDAVDWTEADKLAQTIQLLKLKHCVITSVARDDLSDGGAAYWAHTIRTVKKMKASALFFFTKTIYVIQIEIMNI